MVVDNSFSMRWDKERRENERKISNPINPALILRKDDDFSWEKTMIFLSLNHILLLFLNIRANSTGLSQSAYFNAFVCNVHVNHAIQTYSVSSIQSFIANAYYIRIFHSWIVHAPCMCVDKERVHTIFYSYIILLPH